MASSGFLSLVGVLTLLYFAFNLTASIVRGIKAFLLPSFGARKNCKRYGAWAVVTGGTDGIGKAYATELAKQGINIVLISRSEEKLHVVAEQIESQFAVKTKIIVMDFTGGAEIYQGLEIKLNGLDIGILVNNVGRVKMGFFSNIERDECYKMLNVNCLSLLMMTHIILPGMLSRKRGAVINICSSSADFPIPMMQVYSGTKAFMDFFSTCLRIECSKSNVDIQCVVPYMVATNMTRNIASQPSLMAPAATDYVRQALNTLGVVPRSHGYWPQEIQAYIIRLLPKWFLERYAFNLITLSMPRS